MVHLFAKEIVLHNFGEPAHEHTLEKMVEVLSHLQNVPAGIAGRRRRAAASRASRAAAGEASRSPA